VLAATPATTLLRRLHHLLVLTPPVLEPDFHLQRKSRFWLDVNMRSGKNFDDGTVEFGIKYFNVKL